MSYQARICMPLLTVTGRTGAVVKMKRGATLSGSRSSGTTGTKSVPSAPRPWSQITLAVGGVTGVMTMASGFARVSYFMGLRYPSRRCYDAHMPLDYQSAGVDYHRID